MKSFVVTADNLKTAARWDLDFHLPPVGIQAFSKGILAPVSKAAEIVKTKRDPTKKPDVSFSYVDIASVDVVTGAILNAQELTGEEAPSRARKVIHAYDIIISTCRPTRGAIAVVPEHLHGQICSTGFSVIRPKSGINPFFLHFVIRLDSTLEQFRKWSTGSSYPAILDEDVSKTMVPLPETEVQDAIALIVRQAGLERDEAIRAANEKWRASIGGVRANLERGEQLLALSEGSEILYKTAMIAERIANLPPVEEQAVSSDDEILELGLSDDDESVSE